MQIQAIRNIFPRYDTRQSAVFCLSHFTRAESSSCGEFVVRRKKEKFLSPKIKQPPEKKTYWKRLGEFCDGVRPTESLTPNWKKKFHIFVCCLFSAGVTAIKQASSIWSKSTRDRFARSRQLPMVITGERFLPRISFVASSSSLLMTIGSQKRKNLKHLWFV